jgi:hypothetical protein
MMVAGSLELPIHQDRREAIGYELLHYRLLEMHRCEDEPVHAHAQHMLHAGLCSEGLFVRAAEDHAVAHIKGFVLNPFR